MEEDLRIQPNREAFHGSLPITNFQQQRRIETPAKKVFHIEGFSSGG